MSTWTQPISLHQLRRIEGGAYIIYGTSQLLPARVQFLPDANPQPAYVLARSTGAESECIPPCIGGILHAFYGEGRLSWLLRLGRHPYARLSRQDRPAIQPNCDSAVGTGELQPISPLGK